MIPNADILIDDPDLYEKTYNWLSRMYKELEMKMNHLIQNIKIMMNLNSDSNLKSLNEELLVDLIKTKSYYN